MDVNDYKNTDNPMVISGFRRESILYMSGFNYVDLSFTTDARGQHRGWLLTYEAVDPYDYEGELVDVEGSFVLIIVILYF